MKVCQVDEKQYSIFHFYWLCEAMDFYHSTFPPLPSQLPVTLHHEVCAAMCSQACDFLLKVGYIRGLHP